MAELDPQDEDVDPEGDFYNNFDDNEKGEDGNYYQTSEQGDECELNIDEDNIAAILEQKDKDLRLAAELGKALLEQNAELERRIEQTTEEYNQKLEVRKCIYKISLSSDPKITTTTKKNWINMQDLQRHLKLYSIQALWLKKNRR